MLRCRDWVRGREQLQLWCLPNSTHSGDAIFAIFAMILVLLVEKVIYVAGVKLLML